MSNRIKIFFTCSVLACISSVVKAEDLAEIYRQALTCDPVFQSAKAGYLAATELLPQSRAKLFPNANLIANTSENHAIVHFNQRSFIAPRFSSFPNLDRTYNSRGYTLCLTQPLFNFSSWQALKEANALVKAACARYGAAAQNLIIRVAQAYFNVLLAQDNLRYIHAKKKSTAQQLAQVEARYEVGVESIATLEETRASYDRVVADEIGAQNEVENNFESLRQITGICYTELSVLKTKLPLLTPQPNSCEQWANAAKRCNLKLEAARYAMQAAREKIKMNLGGHLPVLNAVGIHQQEHGAFFDIFNYTIDSAELELTVPLYSGGSVSSQVNQAKYQYQQTCAEMEEAYREAITGTHQQFNNVLTDISKIRADKQAIISAHTALNADQAAFRVGKKTIVDVLLAQQNLLNAEQIYAQDQYSYLMDTLRLKQASGTLSPCDLFEINRWLVEPELIACGKRTLNIPVSTPATKG